MENDLLWLNPRPPSNEVAGWTIMLRFPFQINSFLGQDNKWAGRGNDVQGDNDVDDVDDADVDVDEQRKEFHLENNLVFAILYSLAHSQESPEMTTG